MGGLDAEKLEDAMTRAPGLLRSHQRAVTCDDYEFLARQAYPERIGRVKCIQTRARGDKGSSTGQVFILVIPSHPNPIGFLDPEDLKLDKELVATVDEYLDARRLLTTRLQIRPPAYQWVSVLVRVRALRQEDRPILENSILKRVYTVEVDGLITPPRTSMTATNFRRVSTTV